jgi:uncharacterized protein DUF6967
LLPSREEEQDVDRVTVIEKFRCPYGGQEVELQQVDYEVGGMSLMRLRIREGKRFTIFEIDPITARQWGEAMAGWGRAQAAEAQAG